jgi:hypothetical protein
VVGGDYVLQVAGIQAQYDPTKAPFSGSRRPGGRHHRRLTDTAPCFGDHHAYVAGLGVVANSTGGQLPAVVPKQQDCTTMITDMVRIVTWGPARARQAQGLAGAYGALGGLPLDNGVCPRCPRSTRR